MSSRWQTKLAEATPIGGGWRKLLPGQKGKDQGGQEQAGRTWVHRDNLLKTVQPKAHQADFSQAVDEMSDQSGIIAAHGTGCLSGSTEIKVNRGKTFTISMRELFLKYNHIEGAWDYNLETQAQCHIDEVVRLNLVEAVYKTGTKEVYEIVAGSYSLQATADHRFETPEGFKTLGALKVGDQVLVTHVLESVIALPVTSIESKGLEETYDLTMRSPHNNYVANGFVVHNSGKTLSAIYAFEKLKGEGRAKRALVISPSGLRNNFLDKGVKAFTTSRGEILDKPKELPEQDEYAVVSYDAFRRHPEEYIKALKPDTIIADEVHRASNPESQTYKALSQARGEVPRFIGLTASVVQNKPSDLLPLLNLARGGSPAIPSQGFNRKFVKREKQKARSIFGGPTYEENLVHQALLKASLGSSIHYIEDLDSSEKPTKEVSSVPVQMSEEQLDLYRMSMKGVDPKIVEAIKQGQPVSQSQAMLMFTRLLRARQVSNSLNSVDPSLSAADAAERTPKMKKILDDAAEHLKATPDGQVVLYTNLVHGGVDVLSAGLKARGIPFGVFAGKGVQGMTEEVRQKAVNDYLKTKNRAIIITGAGAEGLSLGNTTMVQLVDGHYNPERIAQAEARGVRAGGLSQRAPEDRKVDVRRYVSTIPKTFWQRITFQPPEGSVDSWVYSVAARKEHLNRQLRDVLQAQSQENEAHRHSMWHRLTGR